MESHSCLTAEESSPCFGGWSRVFCADHFCPGCSPTGRRPNAEIDEWTVLDPTSRCRGGQVAPWLRGGPRLPRYPPWLRNPRRPGLLESLERNPAKRIRSSRHTPGVLPLFEHAGFPGANWPPVDAIRLLDLNLPTLYNSTRPRSSGRADHRMRLNSADRVKRVAIRLAFCVSAGLELKRVCRWGHRGDGRAIQRR